MKKTLVAIVEAVRPEYVTMNGYKQWPEVASTVERSRDDGSFCYGARVDWGVHREHTTHALCEASDLPPGFATPEAAVEALHKRLCAAARALADTMHTNNIKLSALSS